LLGLGKLFLYACVVITASFALGTQTQITETVEKAVALHNANGKDKAITA
jgi:hypothetical protein